jgi:hypothetical protein
MTNIFNTVHVDVYSPFCVAVCGGSFKFIYTLAKNLSGYMYIYLNEEDVWNIWKMFKYFEDEVENHCNMEIKNLWWLDHKGRFLSYKFSKHLRVNELFHKLAFPDIP